MYSSKLSKRVLKYKNKRVVERFSSDMGVSIRESEKIFQDMLKFLWLSENFKGKSKAYKSFSKPSTQFYMLHMWIVIDEMWHTFVLHTVDYQAFCKKYFGHFLHHVPEPVEKKSKVSKVPRSLDWMDDYINYVFDEFGPKVVDRWFVQYPSKYSKYDLAQRRIKAA